VQLDSKGTTVLDKKEAEFETEGGKKTATQVSYHAKPGMDVKNVATTSVKQCTCVKTN